MHVCVSRCACVRVRACVARECVCVVVSRTCGDEYVVECDEVRRDGGVQTLVMYKSCVVKHYQARQTAWLLDRTDRTAS